MRRLIDYLGSVRQTAATFHLSTRPLASFVVYTLVMKSAYELAMERLAKSDPSGSTPLTAEQKSRLGEIDRVYKGKLAEREIFLKKQLDEALAAQKFEDAEKIKQQLASERSRIEEDRDAEKERVRRGK